MIFIDRERKDDQGKVIRPSKSWLNRAKTRTKKMETHGKPAKFDEGFYKENTVKTALEKLFHRKCAYCESKLPESGFDVEHFRPKGKVREDSSHSGYYWLAYKWSNLYPSCRPCNRRLIDYPTYDDDSKGESAGKSEQFPIHPDGVRAMAFGDKLEGEQALLLDPCSDKPETHFTYDQFGQIRAKSKSPRGAVSIEVYNLPRKRLRDRRIEKIRQFVSVYKSKGDTSTFIEDSSEFAGLCRYILDDPDAFSL